MNTKNVIIITTTPFNLLDILALKDRNNSRLKYFQTNNNELFSYINFTDTIGN